MYRIVQYDYPTDTIGHVIFDPGAGKGVSAGTLTLKENDVDDLSLTVNQSSYLFGSHQPMQTHFDVFDDGERIFRGRLLKPTRGMSDTGQFSRSFTCEHILAYLIDSVQPYGVFHNITVESFLGTLLANHNKVVDPYKQVKLGRVTVQDSNNSIYRYIGYATTLDTIKDKLVSRLGGYLVMRVEDDGLYLDYLADTGEDHPSDTPIQIGRNLKSASVTIDPTTVVTRLWPLGATIQTDTEQSSSTDASQPRVEIGAVNGGKAYLDDAGLQSEFGVINGTMTWDDATLPANVLANGKAWLAAQAAATESWEVSAVELGGTFSRFKVSDRYRFINAGVAEPTMLRVVQKQIDFAKPQSSALTIGAKSKSLTQYQLEADQARANAVKLQGTVQGLAASQAVLSKDVQAQSQSFTATQKLVNALAATPTVSLTGTAGVLKVNYIIEPGEMAADSYVPAISGDLNVWTEGTPLTGTTGAFYPDTGGTYYVRVRAKVGDNWSQWSQPAAMTVSDE